MGSQSLQSHLEDGSVYRQDRPTIFGLVWCIRSSVVNRWVLYANPFLRFEQESGFLSFRKPSNNMVNYGYRTLVLQRQYGEKVGLSSLKWLSICSFQL